MAGDALAGVSQKQQPAKTAIRLPSPDAFATIIGVPVRHNTKKDGKSADRRHMRVRRSAGASTREGCVTTGSRNRHGHAGHFAACVFFLSGGLGLATTAHAKPVELACAFGERTKTIILTIVDRHVKDAGGDWRVTHQTETSIELTKVAKLETGATRTSRIDLDRVKLFAVLSITEKTGDEQTYDFLKSGQCSIAPGTPNS